MRCELTRFDLPEMLRCGRELRSVISPSATFEEAAQRVCETLYEGLVGDPPAERGCVLVRCYKTHPLGELPADLQAFAKRAAGPGVTLESSTRCLVLLGSAGIQPTWNSRRLSQNHRAIPLASLALVQRAPMIAQLFEELGVPVERVVSPSTQLVPDVRTKTNGIFYVDDALGSSAVPAQEDFVVPFGVKSVIGFGGELPRGEMLATILFCRVAVPRSVADRFRGVALEVKSAFFVFPPEKLFAADRQSRVSPRSGAHAREFRDPRQGAGGSPEPLVADHRPVQYGRVTAPRHSTRSSCRSTTARDRFAACG